MSTIGKKDPTLDEVIRIIKDMPAREIERKSGVTCSTIYNWRNGKTKRPQNVTMEFALRAAGFKRVIIKA